MAVGTLFGRLRKRVRAWADGRPPLPDSIERGRLAEFEDGDVILGPYPTDEEWFTRVLRQDMDEVVSTLDPANPDDVPWIAAERKVAAQNDLVFTLRPLNAESPDPTTVRQIADYARGRPGRVYVHDFRESQRFVALEAALREAYEEPEKEGARG